MLHLVAFPPSRCDLLRQLADACDDGDSLVLLEDAIWFIQPDRVPSLIKALPDITLYVLDADSGTTSADSETGNITLVDQDGLVSLTEAHERIVSWYP